MQVSWKAKEKHPPRYPDWTTTILSDPDRRKYIYLPNFWEKQALAATTDCLLTKGPSWHWGVKYSRSSCKVCKDTILWTNFYAIPEDIPNGCSAHNCWTPKKAFLLSKPQKRCFCSRNGPKAMDYLACCFYKQYIMQIFLTLLKLVRPKACSSALP